MIARFAAGKGDANFAQRFKMQLLNVLRCKLFNVKIVKL